MEVGDPGTVRVPPVDVHAAGRLSVLHACPWRSGCQTGNLNPQCAVIGHKGAGRTPSWGPEAEPA